MKAHIIKARDKFKAGDVVEVTAAEFETLVEAGYAISEGEHAAKQAVRGANADRIKAAVAAAKKRGAIPPADTAVEARAIERLDAGVDCAVLVELVDAQQPAQVGRLAERLTARIMDDGSLEVAGGIDQIKLGANLRDVCENGYLKAREPMRQLILRGSAADLKEATRISRETSGRLMGHLNPIYARGGDLNTREAVGEVVKASDNVDTNVGTLNTGIVLMRNLGFLKNKLNFLDKITTDLRNEPVQFGQNVITRYITPPAVLTFVPGIGLTSDAATIAAWQATVTATLPQGVAQSSGTQTRSQASTSDVNVVLNKYKGVSILFNNTTIAATLRNLFAEQQSAQIYSLAEQVNKDLLTTLFGANWTGVSTAPFSLAGGNANIGQNFGLANVIAIKNKFTLNKMPDAMRFALMHSTYHDAILTDSNLLSAKAILSLIKKDAGSFEDGELPVLFGVRVLESQLAASKNGALVTITDPTTIPATADTVGFAGNAASAVFVARVPQDYTKIIGEIPATAALEIITEPDSGLSMLVKKRVDHNLEQTVVDCGLMYNFAQGDPRQGFLLKP